MEAASEDPYVELIGAVLLVPTPDEPAVPGGLGASRARGAVDVDGRGRDRAARRRSPRSRPSGAGRQTAGRTSSEKQRGCSNWSRVIQTVASPSTQVPTPPSSWGRPSGRAGPGSPARCVGTGPDLDAGRSTPGAVARTPVAAPPGLAEPAALSGRLLQLDVGSERQLVVFVDLAPSTSEADVSAIMSRLVDGVAARTPDAAGLRFMVVTPEWPRPTTAAASTSGDRLWRQGEGSDLDAGRLTHRDPAVSVDQCHRCTCLQLTDDPTPVCADHPPRLVRPGLCSERRRHGYCAGRTLLIGGEGDLVVPDAGVGRAR